MAFKMNGFSGFKSNEETRAERKAANKAHRQSERQTRKTEREAKPYTQGTKNVSELLGKLADPDTVEKHQIKKGLKGMAGLAAVGAGITKFFNRNKQPGNWWRTPKQ